MQLLKLFLIITASILVNMESGRAQVTQQSSAYYHTGALQPLMAHYEEDRGSLLRFYVIINSPERRERLRQFYLDYASQLQQLEFSKMSSSDKVDYVLFNAPSTMRSVCSIKKNWNMPRSVNTYHSRILSITLKNYVGVGLI